MLHPKIVEELYSVRFRNRGFKRTPVLYPAAEKSFKRFLINTIGQNVFVMTTALGLDVYYKSTRSHTDFIKKNLWLFKDKLSLEDAELQVEEQEGEAVLQYLNRVIDTLIHHPQLFLSCCKKFLQHYRDSGIKTRMIQLLYSTFESHLQKLITDEKTPYATKIRKLLLDSELSHYTLIDNFTSLSKQSTSAIRFN
ncbi:hypothetical protein [Leeuwenhoekiella marinoflava]|uniref:Uncharacterized protein n=2 Tax=Leeuwenhoekiella marinoflava TaxID=988 RepID=A0A4Q0P876_9FLAO|nr:hypothetical protein [Leeuwenhoekiella marinoflava]RXG22356.1 hypothetical protein DSL99_3922 [Leeuwenhoekiella marinoflava]SHF32791.1 hypothetical protein SAMN02745246_02207 [Leeuwenhoekiella marinoflava DSM 3653]